MDSTSNPKNLTMVFSYKFDETIKHYTDFNKWAGYDETLYKLKAHSETDEERIVFLNLRLNELHEVLQYDLTSLISEELLFEFHQ